VDVTFVKVACTYPKISTQRNAEGEKFLLYLVVNGRGRSQFLVYMSPRDERQETRIQSINLLLKYLGPVWNREMRNRPYKINRH